MTAFILIAVLFLFFGAFWVNARSLKRLNTALLDEKKHKNQSLQLLDTFFEYCPLGLALLDREFRYLRVNDSLAETNQRLASDHIGRGIEEVAPALWNRLSADFQAVTQEGISVRRENELEIGGQKRHWLTGLFPVSDLSGGTIGVGLFISDITDRKQMELQLRDWNERFNFAEDAANVGVWEWDTTGKKVVSSARCKTMLGYSQEEVADTLEGWEALVHPEDRARIRSSEDYDAEKTFFHGEYRLRHRDGSYRWLLARGRMESGASGGVRLIGANIDITDKKATETRLLSLTQDLKRSNTELERFAYIASHDLKEPLRMISTYLGLLTRQFGDKLGEKEKVYIGYALDGSKRLNSLVDSLLKFSRIGQDRSDHQPLALREVAQEVIDSLHPSITESGARIRIGSLPTVVGDRVQLRVVFQNLLSNAMKFRHPDAPPEIGIESKIQGGEAVVTVSDQGLGIAEENQAKIFEIFRRLHRRTEFPGEGIGLAACKKIVETHGGKIWVSSQEGNGSSFHFTIPLANHPSLH